MDYTVVEKQRVGRLTIEVIQDEDFSLADALDGKSVSVFHFTPPSISSRTINRSGIQIDREVLLRIHAKDWSGALSAFLEEDVLVGCSRDFLRDVILRETGTDIDQIALADIAVRETTILIAWTADGERIDVEEVRSVLMGDVYGYRILDEHGNEIRLGTGFIGDIDACLEEAFEWSREEEMSFI